MSVASAPRPREHRTPSGRQRWVALRGARSSLIKHPQSPGCRKVSVSYALACERLQKYLLSSCVRQGRRRRGGASWLADAHGESAQIAADTFLSFCICPAACVAGWVAAPLAAVAAPEWASNRAKGEPSLYQPPPLPLCPRGLPLLERLARARPPRGALPGCAGRVRVRAPCMCACVSALRTRAARSRTCCVPLSPPRRAAACACVRACVRAVAAGPRRRARLSRPV